MPSAEPEFTIVWDDAVVGNLDELPSLAAVLDRVAAEAVQTMKRLTPVSPVGQYHRSGTLRSSVHSYRGGNQYGRWIAVGPSADYAIYVNDDTRPHLISSHGDWPLRNRETGQVFGRTVHHPGTRGQHFVERTAETFAGRVYHV